MPRFFKRHELRYTAMQAWTNLLHCIQTLHELWEIESSSIKIENASSYEVRESASTIS